MRIRMKTIILGLMISLMGGLLSEAANNCPNGLVTSVTGRKYIRVGNSQVYTCAGSPSGGTFTWTCSSDLTITSGQNTSSVTVQADTLSTVKEDEFVKCVYTVSGLDCDDKIKVTNFDLALGNAVWWHGYDSDGTTKLNVSGLPGSSSLTVHGVSTGSFKWSITAGSGKLELAADQASTTFSTSVTEADDNSIYVRAKAGSAAPGQDITVQLTNNGDLVSNIKMTVGQATSLDLINVTHARWRNTILGIPVSDGYKSTIEFELKHQLGGAILNYPIGEYFPSAWIDVLANDWPIGTRSGGSSSPAGIVSDDHGVSVNSAFFPQSEQPNTPLGSTLIRHTPQNIRAGKSTANLADISAGVPLQILTINHYLDHASIVIGGTEYDATP